MNFLFPLSPSIFNSFPPAIPPPRQIPFSVQLFPPSPLLTTRLPFVHFITDHRPLPRDASRLSLASLSSVHHFIACDLPGCLVLLYSTLPSSFAARADHTISSLKIIILPGRVFSLFLSQRSKRCKSFSSSVPSSQPYPCLLLAAQVRACTSLGAMSSFLTRQVD